jgi:hypothetical protein
VQPGGAVDGDIVATPLVLNRHFCLIVEGEVQGRIELSAGNDVVLLDNATIASLIDTKEGHDVLVVANSALNGTVEAFEGDDKVDVCGSNVERSVTMGDGVDCVSVENVTGGIVSVGGTLTKFAEQCQIVNSPTVAYAYCARENITCALPPSTNPCARGVQPSCMPACSCNTPDANSMCFVGSPCHNDACLVVETGTTWNGNIDMLTENVTCVLVLPEAIVTGNISHATSTKDLCVIVLGEAQSHIVLGAGNDVVLIDYGEVDGHIFPNAGNDVVLVSHSDIHRVYSNDGDDKYDLCHSQIRNSAFTGNGVDCVSAESNSNFNGFGNQDDDDLTDECLLVDNDRGMYVQCEKHMVTCARPTSNDPCLAGFEWKPTCMPSCACTARDDDAAPSIPCHLNSPCRDSNCFVVRSGDVYGALNFNSEPLLSANTNCLWIQVKKKNLKFYSTFFNTYFFEAWWRSGQCNWLRGK